MSSCHSDGAAGQQRARSGLVIALAGNPNAGKTTLFNALTGSRQHVGNWPGVTIEKKFGPLKGRDDVEIVDLPGIYSLSPYTPEEIVARNYLFDERPDAILNIVDGSNLERNLYLTTQLIEVGIPTVVAVNMMDVVQRSGDQIDLDALATALGCPVVGISALKGTGVREAAEAALTQAMHGHMPKPELRFGDDVETAIAQIAFVIRGGGAIGPTRWLATRLFERDDSAASTLALDDAQRARIEDIVAACEAELDDDPESIIASERYMAISGALRHSHVRKHVGQLSTSDKIDRVVTNRWLALPIFAIVMFLVYFTSVSSVGKWITDWTNDVFFGSVVPDATRRGLEAVGTAPWLVSLIVDGIIGGVGAVLGFVPQLLLLFAFLAFLEACGYMARVAFIMDRVFRRFGLSGKSFIPMLIGTGCSVPGIMASRTIEQERDRRMTIITTSFIPCGAKLTVIALISGALFGGAWWVAPSAYFVGISAVICSGIILKKSLLMTSAPAPFVMELPAYHLPPIRTILRSMWERGSSFIRKAGTVILLATIVVWFGSSYGFGGWGIRSVSDLSESMLADLGRTLAWMFAPLGWGDWQSSVAALTGLVAKESIVGTFGVLFGIQTSSDTGTEIWTALQAHFTPLAGYSFLLFNLLCAPCFAAIGAIRREMNDVRWTWFAVLYQTGFAWIVAFCFYQVGRLIQTGHANGWTGLAVLFLAGFLWLLVGPGWKPGIGKNLRSRAEARA